ncbi:MAG: rhodanese-related sulfurtransferase [Candidatus Obscuribacterales bacterium]|nr:rhodanese-related sulfurtransferase [Steroidobacteraceae bacterium]
MSSLLVAALYKFVDLPDFAALKAPLLKCCEQHHVKGTILLAGEGINGTIAGTVQGVHAVLTYLRSDSRFADLTHKESIATKPPFYRMKVRLKREIVTLGVPGVNPGRMAGTYVKPSEWNKLIDDPNVVVVDVRNDYEVSIGTFKGALNPQTKSFSELPAWVRAAAPLRDKPKVAMFCTGGIRCEKSTAFLRAEGFPEVYHLEGGILKYLESVPKEDSRWEGECFVFDERVAVGHGLKPSHYELCRSCRTPIDATEKSSEFYVEGVSCSNCYAQKSAAKKRGLLERQRQVQLANNRNQAHIGMRLEPKKKAARAGVELIGEANPDNLTRVEKPASTTAVSSPAGDADVGASRRVRRRP